MTRFTIIAIFSPTIPILFFLLFKFNRKEKIKWVFFIILLCSILFDSLGNYLRLRQISSLISFNLFVLTEGIFLHYFFYLLFSHKKAIRRTIIFSLFTLLAIWIHNNIIEKNISNIDNISNGFEGVMVILFCLIYYYQKIRRIDTVPITSKFEFWLVTASFVYVAITFFIFLIPINKITSPRDYTVVKNISRIGNIIYSLLVTISFTINSTKQQNNMLLNKNSIYNITDI